MKVLFTPAGLIALAVFAAILFVPRRSPGLLRRLRKPMQAFDDEVAPPQGESTSGDDASGAGQSDDTSQGGT